MESRRVTAPLAVILALACLILGMVLADIRRSGNTLPDSAVEDLISSLKEAGITADPSLVSGKRETAAVYVLDSEDYAVTVASLLSGSTPARTYAVPDGQIFSFGKLPVVVVRHYSSPSSRRKLDLPIR